MGFIAYTGCLSHPIGALDFKASTPRSKYITSQAPGHIEGQISGQAPKGLDDSKVLTSDSLTSFTTHHLKKYIIAPSTAPSR